MSTTNTHTVDEMNDLRENLGTIIGTINNPETADAIKKLMEQLNAMADKMISSQTTPQTIFTKLKSRKFWMALLGAIAGICGMLNSGDDVTAILIFVILEIASIFGYFFAEGTIDNTRTKELMQMATQIAAVLGALAPAAVAINSATPPVCDGIELVEPMPVEPNNGEYDIPNTPDNSK